MKAVVVRVLCGPLLMGVLCLLGMPLGYYLGDWPGCIVLAVVAIGLGVLIGKRTEGVTAGLAVVLGVLPGIASALGYHNLRELDSGDFVRDVPFAELRSYAGKDRLTLADAVAHEDLEGHAGETVVITPGPSDRHTIHVYCEAYPITSRSWTRSDPVPVWRFGDSAPRQFAALNEAVFHPAPPDELCQKAIDRAAAAFHLRTTPAAIYLQAYVNDSRDERSNRLQGPATAALLATLWIAVALYLSAREAISDWRRRRAKAAHPQP